MSTLGSLIVKIGTDVKDFTPGRGRISRNSHSPQRPWREVHAVGHGHGRGGPLTFYLQVDSRTMAKAVAPQIHNVIHTQLGFT